MHASAQKRIRFVAIKQVNKYVRFVTFLEVGYVARLLLIPAKPFTKEGIPQRSSVTSRTDTAIPNGCSLVGNAHAKS